MHSNLKNNRRQTQLLLLPLFIVCMFFCLIGCQPQAENDFEKAASEISITKMHQHIETLSSDAFGGRAPASEGEIKTIEYIIDQFKELGVEPGNGDSYVQEVPLVEIESDVQKTMQIKLTGKSLELELSNEFVGASPHLTENIQISDSEVVFAGYGIVAPEYQWNDYENIDVKGKTVVVLVNDPGFTSEDSTLFTGKMMTYYGRWTYKFEEAAKQGATAVLVVHETAPASYGWAVVQKALSGTMYDLAMDDGNASKCAFEGWLSYDASIKLFGSIGMDLEELKIAATKRDFTAIATGAKMSIEVKNKWKSSVSNNVAGLIKGTEYPDEYLFFMGHWDHLGSENIQDETLIYNGAQDNATGIAGLIELARAFKALPNGPKRSVVILPVTAEERGLLGSKYYAENPIFPMNKVVAGVNIDMLNVYGPTNDIIAVGYGLSELDEYLFEASKLQSRSVKPDQKPEAGGFYRSDHFNFAKKGVPMLYLKQGTEHVEKGKDWLSEQTSNFNANIYHTVDDTYDPNWDLDGAVQDLKLIFYIGYKLSEDRSFPQYKPGTEFRAIREQMVEK